MNITRHILLPLFAIGAVIWLFWPEKYSINPPLPIASSNAAEANNLRVPQPFAIKVFAKGLKGVRMLQVTPQGNVIASQPRQGRVVLLRKDNNGDGRADAQETLIDNLNQPHGIALHQGWLYIAETDAIIRAPIDEKTGTLTSAPKTVVRGHFPGGGGHWTRTVGIGPDQNLYVSVGSTCNVCIEDHPTRATILRYQLDGSKPEIFAEGLRNTVGFDWHPITDALYGVDNGRDWLGDDFPPCELNLIEQGQHYGWPFANGNKIPDPDFGADYPQRVRDSVPPVHEFAAHNAPLGIHFLNHQWLPKGYQNTALVALHGSWNRSTKDGYKVVSLHFREDSRIEERDFITGFLNGEQVRGRPVDIAHDKTGNIFISDDHSGQIYRVFIRNASL